MGAYEHMLVLLGRRKQHNGVLIDRLLHRLAQLPYQVHALAELRAVRNAGDFDMAALEKADTYSLAAEPEGQFGCGDATRRTGVILFERGGDEIEGQRRAVGDGAVGCGAAAAHEIAHPGDRPLQMPHQVARIACCALLDVERDDAGNGAFNLDRIGSAQLWRGVRSLDGLHNAAAFLDGKLRRREQACVCRTSFGPSCNEFRCGASVAREQQQTGRNAGHDPAGKAQPCEAESFGRLRRCKFAPQDLVEDGDRLPTITS